jgi:hypothetical protein
MRIKAGRRRSIDLAKPFPVVLHQLRNFRRIWKNDGRTGNAAGQSAVDAANSGLAAGNDAPVQFTHGRFIHGGGLRCQFAHPQHRGVMVDGLKMVAEGLAPTVMPCSISSAVSRNVRVLPSMALDVQVSSTSYECCSASNAAREIGRNASSRSFFAAMAANS